MDFTIAHISDVHLAPAPWPGGREWALKRMLGYINWKRARERATDMDTLARLVDDLRAQRPQHVAMTGDIVNLALEREYGRAATWLDALGGGDTVSFTPGNHDAYVSQALDGLAASFSRWTSAETGPGAAFEFPFVKTYDGVRIIGLNSGIPTGLFMATGHVSADQLRALRPALKEGRERGEARVVLIHHAPIPRLLADAALANAGEVGAAIRGEGAELVLHGHHHRRMVHTIESAKSANADRRIPVLGAPSASTTRRDAAHRAAYHLVRMKRSARGFEIGARARGPGADGAIVELPPLL